MYSVLFTITSVCFLLSTSCSSALVSSFHTSDHTSFLFFFFLINRPPPRSPLFPYTTLFRSCHAARSSRVRACLLLPRYSSSILGSRARRRSPYRRTKWWARASVHW